MHLTSISTIESKKIMYDLLAAIQQYRYYMGGVLYGVFKCCSDSEKNS